MFKTLAVMDAGKPDYAMLKEQAQQLALMRYASKIPRDLKLIGVTPLVMGINEVLKPKLVRPCLQRGDWHYWDLYGEFQVSPYTSWPAGGTRSKERFWIPLWHDWYRIVTKTEGVQGMSFDSEGCVVTLQLVRMTGLETLSFDGATPLEAIAKAGLELFAR